VFALATVGLVLAIFGGVLSSKYAAKADSIWNREGHAKAYREAAVAFERKNPGQKVDRKRIEGLARQSMWLPKYVPGQSRRCQKAANIIGGVGFFGFMLVVFTVVASIYVRRREIYWRLVGTRVYH
jgi:predicted cobalt transporter CbtA